MSDDPKDKPRKLRLSKDVNQDTGENNSRSASDAPQDASAVTDKKPLRTGPPPPPSAPLSPSSPSQDNLPEPTESPQSKEGQGGLNVPSGDSSAQASSENNDAPPSKSKLKLSHEPASDRNVKEGSAPPHPDTQTGTMPESRVQGRSPASGLSDSLPVPETKSHSILPSLLIVGLLFLMLGTAGFGLWKILFSAETTNGSQPTTVSSDRKNSGMAEADRPKNPIERAKQTIAKVPQLDMDQLTGDTGPTPSTAKAEPTQQPKPARRVDPPTRVEPPTRAQQSDAMIGVPKTVSKATIGPDENAAASRANPPEPQRANPPKASTKLPAEVEATKATVSKFLAALHIGGMRQGARPMVLINGVAHNVGDTVQAETGLKFSGIRDGKLAFVDTNDIVYLKSF